MSSLSCLELRQPSHSHSPSVWYFSHAQTASQSSSVWSVAGVTCAVLISTGRGVAPETARPPWLLGGATSSMPSSSSGAVLDDAVLGVALTCSFLL